MEIMKNLKIYIGIAIVVLLLGLSFYGGYNYYADTHPITHTTDTITVYDTTTYYIPVDHYHTHIDTIFYPDSVLIPADIDTLAILKDYYAKYRYERVWEDSLIHVSFYDVISENRIMESSLLNYKILRPQTVIINKYEQITYKSYLNLSFKSDLKVDYPELRVQMIAPTVSYGIGYMPKQNALTINFGYNLIKFK